MISCNRTFHLQPIKWNWFNQHTKTKIRTSLLDEWRQTYIKFTSIRETFRSSAVRLCVLMLKDIRKFLEISSSSLQPKRKLLQRHTDCARVFFKTKTHQQCYKTMLVKATFFRNLFNKLNYNWLFFPSCLFFFFFFLNWNTGLGSSSCLYAIGLLHYDSFTDYQNDRF